MVEIGIDNGIPRFGIRKPGIGLSISERKYMGKGKALTLPTKRGTEVAWKFSKEILDNEKQEELFRDIYDLCQKSFCLEDGSEFRKDVRDHIFETHEICIVPFGDVPEGLSPVCFGTDRLAAFASYNFLSYWKNKDFIYFSGIIVDPSLHRLNYGSLLVQEVMRSTGIKIAVLRTQNPVMYGSFAKTCKVFPSLDGKRIPGEIKGIGEYVARNVLHMPNYDSQEMTEKGTYHRAIYGEEPVHDDPELEKKFKEKINIKRGDSMIIVGILRE